MIHAEIPDQRAKCYVELPTRLRPLRAQAWKSEHDNLTMPCPEVVPNDEDAGAADSCAPNLDG